MNIDHWITAALALRKARRVVVFTGAGISAESGIPTFRDADGFWQRFPPETFATWSGLLQTALSRPREVAEFVLIFVEPIAVAQANAGHRALAELQSRVPTTIVTQNVDGLHQAAGSTDVLEIHGTLWEVVDTLSRRVVHRFAQPELVAIVAALREFVEGRASLVGLGMDLGRKYPWDWRGRHRPNLVLFGDDLSEPAWTQARRAADACDVLLSVGTSGAVYPAALIPSRALAAGATVISVDPQAGEGCWLQGPAGEVLPALLRDAFAGK